MSDPMPTEGMIDDLILRAREYEAALRVGGSFPAQAEERLERAKAAMLSASPQSSDELVERLRATKMQTKVTGLYGGALAYSDGDTREVPINPDGPEAAARIAALSSEIAALREAGNRLSLAAQTSGGTAGRDDELVAAIDGWAKALSTSGGRDE